MDARPRPPRYAVLLATIRSTVGGCATVENGCSGLISYVPCRAELDYEADLKTCQALETPTARDACVLEARQRLRDAPLRAAEGFRHGREAIGGKAAAQPSPRSGSFTCVQSGA